MGLFRSKGEDGFIDRKQSERTLAKRRRIIKSNAEPMLSSACKVMVPMMAGLTLLNLLLELVLFIRGRGAGSFASLLKRCGWSAFVIWALFGMAIAIVSALQLSRLKKGTYQEMIYKFKDEIEAPDRLEDYHIERNGQILDDNLQLYAKPDPEAAARYMRYLRIAIGGAILWGLIYLLGLLLTL